jgi:hypothetical protein
VRAAGDDERQDLRYNLTALGDTKVRIPTTL